MSGAPSRHGNTAAKSMLQPVLIWNVNASAKLKSPMAVNSVERSEYHTASSRLPISEAAGLCWHSNTRLDMVSITKFCVPKASLGILKTASDT